MGALKLAAVLGLVSVLLGYYFLKDTDVEPPKMADQWWGKGATPKEDSKDIIKFEIRVNATEIDGLKLRLENTRYFEALEDVQSFQYGFHATYMKQVVNYWMESYLPNWAKHEEHLNKFPHFKTMIGGIMVHFIHIKPKLKTGQTSTPLVLMHGWAGSVYEFYRAIDLLTDQRSDTVFEIICPSIPGFGWSEAPHRAGFDQVATARVFLRLMDRLELNRFYIQGGDWGFIVAKYMALLQPAKILGLHMNMAVYQFPWSPTLGGMARQLIADKFPALFVKTEDMWKVINTAEKLMFWVQEMGFFPLASYKTGYSSAKVKSVPTGLACYSNEVGGCAPKEFTDLNYLNTIHYSDAPKGGHFAAFEVPDYFVKDIKTFVNKVEKLKKDETE